jgi:hypothetical protein
MFNNQNFTTESFDSKPLSWSCYDPRLRVSDANFEFIPVGSLSPDAMSHGRAIAVNRESSKTNQHAHHTKEAELRQECARLVPGQRIEFYCYTGSGNLLILQDNDFDSNEVNESFFGWLRTIIISELLNTPHGQRLFILVLTPDRLFRSVHYNRNRETWKCCPEDFNLFARWLRSCFPIDHERIVFVDASNGMSPEQCRSWQIQLGQEWSGNKGGRPAKRKQYKKTHLNEAIRLATDEKMNAVQIRNVLHEHHSVTITDRAVRQWLQAGNVATKAGRPSKIKHGRFVNIAPPTTPVTPCVSRGLCDTDTMSVLSETLCINTTKINTSSTATNTSTTTTITTNNDIDITTPNTNASSDLNFTPHYLSLPYVIAPYPFE